ncbi:NUDIX domain-containing protein [Neorhizobium sp. DT-125]|uniref:NUDIX domain-containing protein n=1 Tax=Neorhizobium sp. DT-125 TaxID=3396163 RepID=UPI003F1E3F17
MTAWRPPSAIRPFVTGLIWHPGRLLAAEVLGPERCARRGAAPAGVQPPGGFIEFGETREQARRRKFIEELGVEISAMGSWHVIGNILTLSLG